MTHTQTQSQRFEDMPFKSKLAFAQGLSLFFALTVIVFLRRRVGFRMLNPIWLIVMGGALFAASIFFPPALDKHRFALAIYAIAFVIAGMAQRFMRWRDLCQGIRWHTYSPGVSWLEHMPLPDYLRLGRRVARFIDPIAVLFVGFLVGLIWSHALGLWIMLSSLFVFVFEQALYDGNLNKDLDTLDGLIVSEVQAETMRFFQNSPQPERIPPRIEETAGIPTGMAPDIHRQVQLRKARLADAPDNVQAPSSQAEGTPPMQGATAATQTPDSEMSPRKKPIVPPDNLAKDGGSRKCAS